MVRTPIELSFDDLAAMELIEQYVTIGCVSNLVGGNLVSTAAWRGVRLRDLLARAGVDPRADQVIGRSVDGFTVGFPTTAALDDRGAMIAIGMNGTPLPLEHGFPARLIVPGLYGYVSATKWLSDIELGRFDQFDAYWVQRGWAQQGPILTQSRIDVPQPQTTSPGGNSPGRRRRVGTHPRYPPGRSPSRRPGLASRPARRRAQHRHVAPMGLPLGRDPGLASPSRPAQLTAPAHSKTAPTSRPDRTARPATTPSTSKSSPEPDGHGGSAAPEAWNHPDHDGGERYEISTRLPMHSNEERSVGFAAKSMAGTLPSDRPAGRCRRTVEGIRRDRKGSSNAKHLPCSDVVRTLGFGCRCVWEQRQDQYRHQPGNNLDDRRADGESMRPGHGSHQDGDDRELHDGARRERKRGDVHPSPSRRTTPQDRRGDAARADEHHGRQRRE